MGGWYRVIKTIKGNRYIYEQQTFRENGRVRTRNRYLGRADSEVGSSTNPGHPILPTTPLFTDPSDFGRALAAQFDAPQWGRETQAQLLGGASNNSRRAVTTTPQLRAPASLGRAGKQANQAGGADRGNPARDVQAEITNKIINAIETGQANGKFEMPWQAIASVGVPVNAVTHQPYHGVNILFLSLVAAERTWPNQWASFQQWKERGASVRKGEHGAPIVFYTPLQIREIEEDEDGKKTVVMKTIPVFRYSTVFNISQVDNPPPSVTTTPADQVNSIETAEQFIDATKADMKQRVFFSQFGLHPDATTRSVHRQ